MMEWEKQLHQLSDRLSYLKDIFPGKHEEDIALLESRLDGIRRKLENCSQEEAQAEMTSLLPMMKRTAMVSPTARPSPRKTAPRSPCIP